MAEQEHAKLIFQGVKSWNQWRKQHANIIPKLASTNFKGGNFQSILLSRAILSRAILSNSNFSNADLSEANLIGSFLSGTNLTKAKLNGAHLNGANLTKTILILAVPVQPLLHSSEKEYGMFPDLWKKYPWVLQPYHYNNTNKLLTTIKLCIIDPAEKKAKEIEKWKH